MKIDFDRISKADINGNTDELNEVETAFHKCLNFNRKFAEELDNKFAAIDKNRMTYNLQLKGLEEKGKQLEELMPEMFNNMIAGVVSLQNNILDQYAEISKIIG